MLQMHVRKLALTKSIYVFNANDTTKPMHFFNLMIILFKTKDDLQPKRMLTNT